MGEWSSWVWVGGCLLGLVLLERAHRKFFPGEKSLLSGRLGRTRRREIPGGIGSGNRIVPHGNLPIQKLVPQLPQLSNQLVHDDPELVARRIRKVLFETRCEPSRAVLTCLLAEVALLQRDREEASCRIEEALEILDRARDPLDWRTLVAWEWLSRFRVNHFLQEGRVSEVLKLLDDSEFRLGFREWIALSRAQAYLLMGKEDLCRRETLPLLVEENSASCKRSHNDVAWARLLLGESYLQDREMDKLKVTIRNFGPRPRLTEGDHAVFARLQLEILLHLKNRPAAWRQVGVLARLCEKNPNHQGLSRNLHQACARLHAVEGDYVEAHRRLQLAENDAEYPVALWDVRLQLGMLLEAEGRYDEAISVWDALAKEAVKTRYGSLAESRRIRLVSPPQAEETATVPSAIPTPT